MKNSLKQELLLGIEESMPSIIDIVKDIGEHPELGYKEHRTSAIVDDYLSQIGYTTERLAITGVKAKLKNDLIAPTIAVLGELDGIVCAESPKACKLTDATHNCGHNLQLGVMLAVAKAFKAIEYTSDLVGNIAFMACPAEEYIELDYRMELRRKGNISYLGGKQELVKCGAFDDVDAALMVHSQSNQPNPFVGIVDSGNGLIAQNIQYIGKTAHAGAAPEEGINALSAAILGINAVNALRETLKDHNHNRIHYIITKGGDIVNSVPSDVRLECMVRANSIQAIQDLLNKTHRAFVSGGEALQAETQIHLLSGYLPLVCNESLNSLFAQHAEAFVPAEQIVNIPHFSASTDMGDITHLMPGIHCMVGGIHGALHAADYEVVDYKAAIEIPAKIITSMIVDLFSDGAKKINTIIKNSSPLLTKDEYISLLDSFFS